jgi:hypothetical protein
MKSKLLALFFGLAVSFSASASSTIWDFTWKSDGRPGGAALDTNTYELRVTTNESGVFTSINKWTINGVDKTSSISNQFLSDNKVFSASSYEIFFSHSGGCCGFWANTTSNTFQVSGLGNLGVAGSFDTFSLRSVEAVPEIDGALLPQAALLLALLAFVARARSKRELATPAPALA